jgi:hypothetical protein
MAELWSLLHFIMPELFDSHDEFNEWFSKDIQEHASGGGTTSLNTRQLHRLHAILNPFMLRRVKRDVEHEMPPKIEVQVNCQLSQRQLELYASLQGRVFQQGGSQESLINLVMQFRKVCNHPEIFKRRDVTSPLRWMLPHRQSPPPPFGTELFVTVTNTNPYCNPIIYELPCLIAHMKLPGSSPWERFPSSYLPPLPSASVAIKAESTSSSLPSSFFEPVYDAQAAMYGRWQSASHYCSRQRLLNNTLNINHSDYIHASIHGDSWRPVTNTPWFIPTNTSSYDCSVNQYSRSHMAFLRSPPAPSSSANSSSLRPLLLLPEDRRYTGPSRHKYITNRDGSITHRVYVRSSFSFLRFVDTSAAEYTFLQWASIWHRWLAHIIHQHRALRTLTIHYRSVELMAPDQLQLISSTSFLPTSPSAISLSPSPRVSDIYPTSPYHTRALLLSPYWLHRGVTSFSTYLPRVRLGDLALAGVAVRSIPPRIGRPLQGPRLVEVFGEKTITDISAAEPSPLSSNSGDRKTNDSSINQWGVMPDIPEPLPTDIGWEHDWPALAIPYADRAHQWSSIIRLTWCTTSAVLAPPIVPLVYCSTSRGSARNNILTNGIWPRVCGWESSLLNGLEARRLHHYGEPPLPIGHTWPSSFGETASLLPIGLHASMAYPSSFGHVPYSHYYSPMPTIALAGLMTEPLSQRLLPTPSSDISVPNFGKLITDSGKLTALDHLLTRLKRNNHRVLIFSQMTKMMSILEDFMRYRRHKYFRLDGSTNIADRRDMVKTFQTNTSYFVFLLSTRAGGLGINLTSV